MHPQWNGEGERCSPPELALQAKITPHALHQAGRDGNAQTRATMGPGVGGVGLEKRTEDPPLVCRCDSDARVADGKPDLCHPVVQRHHFNPNYHFAGNRELDGIPHQVEEDLPQARRISHDVLR